jgi:hypothetical protein
MAVRLIPALIVAAGTAGPAAAYEQERAQNELGAEFAECAAYYSLSSAKMGRVATGKDVAAAADQAYRTALEMSARLTDGELARSRVRLVQRSMGEEVDNDAARMSILIEQYGAKCEDLFENVDERLRYWLQKEG